MRLVDTRLVELYHYITVVMMINSKPLQCLLYATSTLAGLFRINDKCTLLFLTHHGMDSCLSFCEISDENQ